jgi:hypothetical protein
MEQEKTLDQGPLVTEFKQDLVLVDGMILVSPQLWLYLNLDISVRNHMLSTLNLTGSFAGSPDLRSVFEQLQGPIFILQKHNLVKHNPCFSSAFSGLPIYTFQVFKISDYRRFR